MEVFTAIFEFLNYFGINRESAGPLVLATGIFYLFFRHFAEKPILSMKSNVTVIKDAVCEIQAHITDSEHKTWLHKLPITSYGEAHSPMLPNELGKKILDESGFSDIYPEVKSKVFPLLDSKNTRTLYDAEKNSEAILTEIAGDPIFDTVKSYVVSNPTEAPDLDLIFGIASWILRDDYAKEKGIEK